jgi:hypothetical protein
VTGDVDLSVPMVVDLGGQLAVKAFVMSVDRKVTERPKRWIPRELQIIIS